jgi:hypothetical protein
MVDSLVTFEKCDGRTRLKIILWSVGIILFGIFLTAYSPTEYLLHALGYEGSNGCLLLTFAGVPCPLCGMGRSFWAIVSLDFNSSIYYNPSATVFFPVSGVILLTVILSAAAGYKIQPGRRILRLWYLFVLLIAAIWVLNILFGHHW